MPRQIANRGDAAVECAADQRQAGRIAARVERPVRFARLPAIERRVDVGAGAAGEHAVDAVENLVHIVPGLQSGNEKHHQPGALDRRADILVGGNMPDIAVEFAEIAGDGNDRFRHRQTPVIIR